MTLLRLRLDEYEGLGSMTSEISLDGIVINGTQFGCGEPLSAYELVLGHPSRSIMPGPPPPYGHRNNVLHFYDDLGILLREHHSSYLIQEIELGLEPFRLLFPTNYAYTGELTVCSVRVTPGMPFSEFAGKSQVQFHPHLGHAWYVDGEKVSIQMEVYCDESGLEPVELISTVVVGFVGANRNQKNVVEHPYWFYSKHEDHDRRRPGQH